MRDHRPLARLLFAAAVTAFGLGATAAHAETSCDRLPGRAASKGVRLTVVDTPAGSAAAGRGRRVDLPAHCAVAGKIRARPGSEVGFELWLPKTGWNGRVLMFGNGGYASSIPTAQMGQYLALGYAVVGTDTGHTGDDPDFAVGHPEAIADWGNRAVHETIVRAKAIAATYYARSPAYAYFQGCSTGGHQALMEAQRYPEDFNGIVAGAPGSNRTHLNVGFLWQFVQNHTRGPEPQQIVPATKLPLLTRAVLAACGGQNGGEAGGLPGDPYLNNPLACRFDPTVLTCKDGDNAQCLTADQVRAVQHMYDGARNPRTGERIYFGWPKGSESSNAGAGGWSTYWANPANQSEPARANFWRQWAFPGKPWNWQSFDFDQDVRIADDRLAQRINGMDADLEPFRRRGGKLIQYHGLADPVVAVEDSIVYSQRVNAEQAGRGRSAGDFYRLFLAPGMEHCGGGLGPAPVELQQSIEAWVEAHRAPERLLASRASDDRVADAFSRPLCPYPEVAQYDGHGPKTAAASFSCAAPASTPKVEPPGRAYLR